MTRRIFLFTAFFLFASGSMVAQNCTQGQSPGTSFPVCGTDTFFQSSVPACGGTTIPLTGCAGLADINAYWYRFTAFEGGTLGFSITPNDLADDYDWQLFDITGVPVAQVYTNPSLAVAANWSGAPGNTGASAQGTKLFTCGSVGNPPYESGFSSMPTLIKGHDYILMVSHFTVTSQSGYALSFGSRHGGTAVITDPTDPGLKSARAICDGEKITVKLNKRMRCSSLNPNGSDFIIIPSIAPIISAEPVNCDNGFDMDSILITLAGPIPPGDYVIAVNSGTDGQNLLDNCGRTIPDKQSYTIIVFPLISTPMDSLTKPGCAPDEIELVFKRPMRCNTIAADGSDFTVTNGQAIIPVATASGVCDNSGLTNVINVKLASPIQSAGNYRITLKTGTDGNTVINECGLETPAGSQLPFTTVDTVSAAFTQTLRMGCTSNIVDYSHDGRNAVNKWQWTFENISSNKKDTSITYPISFSKNATLIVSNGTCNDTATQTIIMDNAINAAFEGSSFACPGDPVTFKDKSTGKFIRQWLWDMGDGKTSTQQNPPQQLYLPDLRTRDIQVRLIVTDSIGCKDTAYNKITVVNNCYIAIPKAFTPNGDGLNDFLFPTNAYKSKNLRFSVYNRAGQKIFETTNWMNKWDGTFKGSPQDPGTYVWTLTYTHTESGERFNLKGTTVLLR